MSAGAISLMACGAVPVAGMAAVAVAPFPPGTYAVMPQLAGPDPNRIDTPTNGALYLDAALQRVIVWNGDHWTDLLGAGAAV